MQEQLKEKIAALGKQIEALTKERNSLRQQYAEGQTDLKIGDRVKKDGGTDVWQLTAIRLADYGNEPKFFGNKIKNDGTPGVVIHEIWVGYNKKLVRANVQIEGLAATELERSPESSKNRRPRRERLSASPSRMQG